MINLTYRSDRRLTAEEFVDILTRSTLAERRPVEDRRRMAEMVERASLLCTAWDGERLVGVARSMTDFVYCCYMSELAVDTAYQGRGVGTELIRLTQSRLGPEAKIVLLAAPKARDYYPKIGMTRHDSAWMTPAVPLLENRHAAERGNPVPGDG